MFRSAHLVIALAAVLSPAAALGHAHLLTPTPRNTLANKTGPCGAPKTAMATKFAPGQTITVTWTETINHPGTYRIAFSPAGDTGFDQNILADNIPNPAGAQAMNSRQVTLPNISCTTCTLQLIQVMTNTTPPSNYYSCTDLVLEAPNASPTVATPAASAPAVVSGTTAALSVLGADDGGEAALTYSWAATTAPDVVTFSVNGTNAAKNATATFRKAGNYGFTVTIRDATAKTVTSSVNVTVSQTLSTVSVTPATATVLVGATRQLSAAATDQFGAALATPPTFNWTTTGGGTVSAAGLFTAGAVAGGPFTVTAASGARTGSASITVSAGAAPTIAQAASVPAPTVTGTSTAVSVLGADDGGEANLLYTWSAPVAPGPVGFTPNGVNGAKNAVATFSRAGSYTLRATVRDATGQTAISNVTITVGRTLTAVSVSPSSVSVGITGSVTFSAEGSDQFGLVIAPAPVFAWSTSGGGTITSTGVLTAAAVPGGPFTVTATSAGKSGNATLMVNPGNAPTVAQPASAGAGPVTGTSASLSALGADDGGEANLLYTWSSKSGPMPVTFAPNGTNAAKASVATFAAAGTYVLEVTMRDASGATAISGATVVVSAVATTVQVTPATVMVSVGASTQLSALVRDQFQASLSVQPTLTWSSGGGGSVSGTGLFTAADEPGGPYTVTATGSGRVGTAQVTVTESPIPRVLQPATANPARVTGVSAELSVLATDDGGEAQLRYTWSAPGAPAPVTFEVNGTNAAKVTRATFGRAGNYTIAVSIEDGQGQRSMDTVNVSVEPTITRVAITPESATVAAGQSKELSATARDQFLSPLATQPAFNWSVSGGGKMSAGGVFTAPATAGTSRIVASVGAIEGTATVQVTASAVDITPPTVVVTVPAGTVFSGVADLTASASDDREVSQLDFELDGAPVATLTAPPWEVEIDTLVHANGEHLLQAIASDAAGHVVRSEAVRVEIRNVAVAPKATLLPEATGCSTAGGAPLAWAGALAMLAGLLARRRSPKVLRP